MNPGDRIVCTSCGAEARVWTSCPARFQEGDPLLVTWCNGPHPRHEAAREAPEVCSWCRDRALGFPSLLSRPLPSEAPWTAGGPGCTFEIPVIGESATPAPAAPRPDPVIAAEPEGDRRCAKSALDRFEELAQAFHAETGLWPPRHERAVGLLAASDRVWADWCGEQASKAAPKRPPKRGTQLGLF